MVKSSVSMDFSVAILAQGCALIVSAVTTFFFPKFLGIEQFGYWQLFLFYGSYLYIFLMGTADGIYLVYGGISGESLDEGVIGSVFWYTAIIQIFLCLAGSFLAGHIIEDAQRRNAILGVCLLLPLSNSTIFLGIVFQAINETKKYSLSVVIERVSFLVFFCLSLFLQLKSFQVLVFGALIARAIAFIYCVVNFRHVVFFGILPIKQFFGEFVYFVRIGIKLTISNIISLLILGLSRFFMDSMAGVEQFSQLSLASLFITFFILLVSQISMILFPKLMKLSPNRRAVFYIRIGAILSVLLPVIYFMYVPIRFFIALWLPSFSDAGRYLGYLMPICVFESKFLLSYFTFLKTERKEALLLWINSISLILLLALLTFFWVTHNLLGIVISTDIAVVLKCLLCIPIYFKGKYKLGIFTSLLEVASAILFIICTHFQRDLLGLVLILLLTVGLFTLHRAELLSTFESHSR